MATPTNSTSKGMGNWHLTAESIEMVKPKSKKVDKKVAGVAATLKDGLDLKSPSSRSSLATPSTASPFGLFSAFAFDESDHDSGFDSDRSGAETPVGAPASRARLEAASAPTVMASSGSVEDLTSALSELTVTAIATARPSTAPAATSGESGGMMGGGFGIVPSDSYGSLDGWIVRKGRSARRRSKAADTKARLSSIHFALALSRRPKGGILLRAFSSERDLSRKIRMGSVTKKDIEKYIDLNGTAGVRCKMKGILNQVVSVYEQLSDSDRTPTMRMKMVEVYSQLKDLENALQVLPFVDGVCDDDVIDLHWKGMLGDRAHMIPIESQGRGVPLCFARLLVERNTSSTLKVITGYRGGNKLQQGLLASYARAVIDPENPGTLSLKK